MLTRLMVKVGIIQTMNYSSDQQAINKVSKQVEKLAKKETDIICLPEQWLKNNQIKDFDLEFSTIKQISKDYHVTVIPGAFYHKQGKSDVITSPVIGPKGEIIGFQNKIHPFDYEKKIVTPGKSYKVFKTACKFGILICYDMVFADVAKKMVKNGAEILISPSRIVKRGVIPWHMYVQVRALENRIPIAAANVENKRFGGKGLIVDLIHKNGVMIPKVATTTKSQPEITANFDVLRYKKHRKSRFSD